MILNEKRKKFQFQIKYIMSEIFYVSYKFQTKEIYVLDRYWRIFLKVFIIYIFFKELIETVFQY